MPCNGINMVCLIQDNNINSIELLPDLGELHFIQSGDALHITSIYITHPGQGHLTRIFPYLIKHFRSKVIRTITLVSPHQFWTKFGFTQHPDGTWRLEL